MKRQLRIRDNLITGLLLLAPIGAVLWIVVWLWSILFKFVSLVPAPLNLRSLLNIENAFALQILDAFNSILVFFIVLSIVWLIGLFSRNYLVSKILRWVGRMVSHVPVLNSIYSTVEQLTKTFSAGKTKNFRRVVYVEYPRKGIQTLALVTGESDVDPVTGQRGKHLSIFVPTTPNPTSGFYLKVPESEVTSTDLTVEQALKEIISMGMVHVREQEQER